MVLPSSQAGPSFSQGCRRVARALGEDAESTSPGQWEPREA